MLIQRKQKGNLPGFWSKIACVCQAWQLFDEMFLSPVFFIADLPSYKKAG
jgi:hypothetical protein